MLHFRRLLVNNQTEADTHLSDPTGHRGVRSQTSSVRHQQLSVSLLSGCCVLFTVCLEETRTQGSSQAEMWGTRTFYFLEERQARSSVVSACSWRGAFKDESGSWDKI